MGVPMSREDERLLWISLTIGLLFVAVVLYDLI